MNPLPANAALIVIDVQQAFDNPCWGERNNPHAERQIATLLAAWRAAQRPVLHVHHRSRHAEGLFNPAGPGFAVKPEAAPLPGEPVVVKEVNSAFIGTDLEARLRAGGVTTLVIVGITTDHCVSTTARMAGNMDFVTVVVSDATATFERTGPTGLHFSAETMHQSALASIHGEFALVVETAAVLQAMR